jgi:hypothetical protein
VRHVGHLPSAWKFSVELLFKIFCSLINFNEFCSNYAACKTKIVAYHARIFVIFAEIKIGTKEAPIRFPANSRRSS